jgi:hypothetical protein
MTCGSELGIVAFRGEGTTLKSVRIAVTYTAGVEGWEAGCAGGRAG